MELYEGVYKDLYRFAYWYLGGNSHDAEDVVSEAVLKAYENFSSLRREESFRAWIFQILVNQCRHHLRRRKSCETVELKDEPFYLPTLDDRTMTIQLLEGLSEEERAIVALTVFGGYKGEEIARIMNRRHSTIRSKYRRALKKLEKQLEAEVSEVRR